MEALQYGACPIYISDEFLFNNGCFEASSIVEVMEVWPHINHKTAYNNFAEHYTYEAVANRIYENL